ncbi:MAG: NHLP leader peptide family RiPP precursor [Bacteroidota bacterium]
MGLTKEQILFKKIVEKAWEDEAFKAALIQDPVSTIEALSGERLTIPEGKTMVVKDQTDQNTIFINLVPPEPCVEDMELTEDQLDIVSGGGDLLPVIQGLGGATTGG